MDASPAFDEAEHDLAGAVRLGFAPMPEGRGEPLDGKPEEVAAKPRRARRRPALDLAEVVPPAPGSVEEIRERFKPRVAIPHQAPALAVVEVAADEPYKLPALSRANLAAMFANMMANGMTLEDFN